jgi:hypothetical protein
LEGAQEIFLLIAGLLGLFVRCGWEKVGRTRKVINEMVLGARPKLKPYNTEPKTKMTGAVTKR